MPTSQSCPRHRDVRRTEKLREESGDVYRAPDVRLTFTEDEQDKLKERAAEYAGNLEYPELQMDMWALIQLCREIPANGGNKESQNTATDMLVEIKRKWYALNVAVIVSTISKLDEQIFEEFKPSWAFLEEAKYIYSLTPRPSFSPNSMIYDRKPRAISSLLRRSRHQCLRSSPSTLHTY